MIPSRLPIQTLWLTTLVFCLALLSGCPVPTAQPPADDGHDHGAGTAHDETDHDEGDVHDQGEPAHEEDDDHDENDPEHDHANDEADVHAEDEADTHAEDEVDLHEDEDVVHLTDREQQEFGIVLATATSGTVAIVRELPGEIAFNPDRVAHVQPRVSGVVRDVNKSVGNHVKSGEVLATLESRELAQAITGHLAAQAREQLAETIFEREKQLWQDQISSERTYLQAQQTLAERRIETSLTEGELHALGLTHDAIATLADLPDEAYLQYSLVAPIDGVITERHLVQGEIVHAETHEPPFVIADVSSVWVSLTVYARDLADIRIGQSVTLHARDGDLTAQGVIDFISPSLQESTRTGTARMVLDNTEGHWRPGLFVTGIVQVREVDAEIVVPRTAMQTINGATMIFVEHETDEFEPREVTLGEMDESHAVVLTGLEPGDRFVAVGGFALKTELNKAALEHAGHAH